MNRPDTNKKTPQQCQMILVEDSQDDASLLLTLLKMEDINLEIQHFLDGKSACDRLENLASRKSSDGVGELVLLDLNLPGMSGKDILKRINERGSVDAMHIVIFSGSDNPVDVEECLASGAKNYYVKPWDLDGYQSFIQGPFLKELKEVCPCLAH